MEEFQEENDERFKDSPGASTSQYLFFFLSAPFKSSISLLLIYCQKSVWSKNNQEQCGFSFAQNFLLFEPYL